MNHVVLPIAKFAYYGGTLNYENTEKLYQLFDELKCFLQTNGEGWEKAMTITCMLFFFGCCGCGYVYGNFSSRAVGCETVAGGNPQFRGESLQGTHLLRAFT